MRTYFNIRYLFSWRSTSSRNFPLDRFTFVPYSPAISDRLLRSAGTMVPIELTVHGLSSQIQQRSFFASFDLPTLVRRLLRRSEVEHRACLPASVSKRLSCRRRVGVRASKTFLGLVFLLLHLCLLLLVSRLASFDRPLFVFIFQLCFVSTCSPEYKNAIPGATIVIMLLSLSSRRL